jgi:Protein of unknown function (DUF3761)
LFLARRTISIIALATGLFASLAAQNPQPSTSQTAPLQERSQPKCADNGTYINRNGETVKRPETWLVAPKGAMAQCRDGSYSFSRSRRGTCSHHGGVAKWL